MSFFQHNDEDVERFIDALRCNPHAVPPKDLDAETAFVIRELVAHYTSQSAFEDDCSPNGEELIADDGLEQRVWDRVLFATLAPPDINPSYLQPRLEVEAVDEMSNEPVLPVIPVVPCLPPLASSLLIVLPLPSTPVVYRRQKLDLSFVAAMLIAVFCFTGLLVQQDTLQSNQRRYGTPSKADMSVPTLDTTWPESNPELFIRYQPTDTMWERLALDSETEEPATNAQVSLMIPVSLNKHYPE